MISLIVAIGKNNVIGLNNDLPWYYPSDLKYFKETTLNHQVVMGRATFESIINRIGKPLPKRQNIVVTRDKNFNYPNVQVVHDLEAFLDKSHTEEIFVIGGKQIYDLALKYANRLYITHINKEYPGNVYFSEIDYSKYTLVSKRDEDELSFCVYERI